jgi:hypothetical protein
VDVDLLVIPHCPNEDAVVQLVRRALDDVGLSRVLIRTRVVETEAEAQRLRFVGSPTVRIDGEDPFADPRRPVALTCRVYVTDGACAAIPDLRLRRQALQRAGPSGGTRPPPGRGRQGWMVTVATAERKHPSMSGIGIRGNILAPGAYPARAT